MSVLKVVQCLEGIQSRPDHAGALVTQSFDYLARQCCMHDSTQDDTLQSAAVTMTVSRHGSTAHMCILAFQLQKVALSAQAGLIQFVQHLPVASLMSCKAASLQEHPYLLTFIS